MPLPILAASAIMEIANFAAPYVVKLVDKIFGDKSGAVKKPVADNMLEAIFAALRGLDPSIALPTKEEVPAIVEGTVKDLNSKKELNGKDTMIDDDQSELLSGTLLLLEGTMKVVKVATRKR